MVNHILYGSMIAIMSILVISTAITQIDAKSFDKEAESTYKGNGVYFFSQSEGGTAMTLQIFPIKNSHDVRVELQVDKEGINVVGKQCIGSKQILKVSGTNKASSNFNTSDLECNLQDKGPDGMISMTLVGTGESIEKERYDSKKDNCNTVEDVEYCTRVRGSLTHYPADGSISGYDLELLSSTAGIIVEKRITTEWTNP